MLGSVVDGNAPVRGPIAEGGLRSDEHESDPEGGEAGDECTQADA